MRMVVEMVRAVVLLADPEALLLGRLLGVLLRGFCRSGRKVLVKRAVDGRVGSGGAKMRARRLYGCGLPRVLWMRNGAWLGLGMKGVGRNAGRLVRKAVICVGRM